MNAPLTCLDLLAIAHQLKLSDSEICNRAKTMKMKLSRSTLWRIRTDKLKGNAHWSTFTKLAKVISDAQ